LRYIIVIPCSLWRCVVALAGNIRNLAMEKVAGSVMFPCRYVSNGCNATMPHTDKSSHEDGCEFRSVRHQWASPLLMYSCRVCVCDIYTV